MRIIRAPLRVSLFGGGTDRPAYYREHGGLIVSFAITRYMHLVHNPRPTGGCRLSYGEVEELSSLTTAKHTLVRAVAGDIEEPCTLTVISDVPKGTGLGSSSALAVCLCKLTNATRRSGKNLATTAFEIEHAVAPEVGTQDHLPAAFGGFNIFTIHKNGIVVQKPLSERACVMINNYGLLLYTGVSRKASTQLKGWTKSEDRVQLIHQLAQKMQPLFEEKSLCKARKLGAVLHQTWEIKRRIGTVSNPTLDEQYEKARDAGAFGGKLCGAGAGGCWFFLVNPCDRQAVVDSLELAEIPFQIAEKGCEEWVI